MNSRPIKEGFANKHEDGRNTDFIEIKKPSAYISEKSETYDNLRVLLKEKKQRIYFWDLFLPYSFVYIVIWDYDICTREFSKMFENIYVNINVWLQIKSKIAQYVHNEREWFNKKV